MILIGLGSNLGERECQLEQALQRLEQAGDLRIVSVSNLYETKPVGDTDQPEFLSLCILKIEKLIQLILEVLKKMRLLLLLFVTQKLVMLEFKLILLVITIQKVNLKENLLLYL